MQVYITQTLYILHLTSHLPAAPGDSFCFHGAPKTFHFQRARHGKLPVQIWLTEGNGGWVTGHGTFEMVFVVDDCWSFHWSFSSAWRGICHVHIGLPNGLGMTHSYTIYTIYLASLGLVIYVPHNYWGIESWTGYLITQIDPFQDCHFQRYERTAHLGGIRPNAEASRKWWRNGWDDSHHHSTLQGNIFHLQQSSTSTSQQSTVAPYCSRRVPLPVHRWLAPYNPKVPSLFAYKGMRGGFYRPNPFSSLSFKYIGKYYPLGVFCTSLIISLTQSL